MGRKNLTEIKEVFDKSPEHLSRELQKDIDTIYEKIEKAALNGLKRAVVEQAFYRHISQTYTRINGVNTVLEALEADGYTINHGNEQIVISGWA